MNKVITINLNGRAYQLEEAGYEALDAYLDDAKVRLKDDPGESEIIADLEQAIAEKCDKVLTPHKSVVLSSEIESILKEMGTVEGGEKRTQDERTQSHTAPKRLYLIREGAILTGVCTGLAAYFDIDVTIVRILFVVLTVVTSGIGIPVYIACALILPYADTIEARAAAHGQAFKAQDIVDRAKERFETTFERVSGHKMDWGNMGEVHERHLKWKQLRKMQRRQWKEEYRNRYRHPNPVMGFISGAFGLLWIFALLSLITTGAIFGWMIPAGIPIWAAIIVLFVIYHAVTGPLRGASYAYQWQNGQYYPAYDAWEGFIGVLTALFIAIAIGWAYLHIPQVHDFLHHPLTSIKDGYAQINTWWDR